MTIPNLLTILRILLTPLLVYLLLDNRLKEALVVFFIAGMTDGLDGLIARVFNQKSKLGAYLDPLADKLLLVTSFITLATLGLIPTWLVIITVGRDLAIVLGLAALMFHHVPVKIRPSAVSKATTLMQLLTVLATMGSGFILFPRWTYLALFFTTALFTIASGTHYVMAGCVLYRAEKTEVKKLRS